MNLFHIHNQAVFNNYLLHFYNFLFFFAFNIILQIKKFVLQYFINEVSIIKTYEVCKHCFVP